MAEAARLGEIFPTELGFPERGCAVVKHLFVYLFYILKDEFLVFFARCEKCIIDKGLHREGGRGKAVARGYLGGQIGGAEPCENGECVAKLAVECTVHGYFIEAACGVVKLLLNGGFNAISVVGSACDFVIDIYNVDVESVENEVKILYIGVVSLSAYLITVCIPLAPLVEVPERVWEGVDKSTVTLVLCKRIENGGDGIFGISEHCGIAGVLYVFANLEYKGKGEGRDREIHTRGEADREQTVGAEPLIYEQEI